MAQNAFSGLAALVVLTFFVMALNGCASSEQFAAVPEPIVLAAVAEPPPGQPEFHGARIGRDALRSRLPGE